jgi:hypothetical protein
MGTGRYCCAAQAPNQTLTNTHNVFSDRIGGTFLKSNSHQSDTLLRKQR